MKYKALRSFIRSKQLKQDLYLHNCEVVIDAKSYFNEHAYGKSGCQYILGAECDRYANYLKNTLNIFKECSVTCYVVFNGAMNADVETRKQIHEKTIKDRCEVKPENDQKGVFDPVFVKDVQKEILKELGIKYFCCDYDSTEAIISVGKEFQCPVITNNIEYSLCGVSCIPPNSIVIEKKSNRLACSVYEYKNCIRAIGIRDDLMPIFLTLVDEDGAHFGRLTDIIPSRQHNLIPSVTRWVRRQSKNIAMNTILGNLTDENERRTFLDSCNEKWNVVFNLHYNLAVTYFYQKEPYDLFNSDLRWLPKGVSNGRIAVPYVNLKNKSAFLGCWQIYEKNKDDAMLAAIDIICFVHCLLTESQLSTLTFIGRKLNVCYVWEMEKKWDNPIPHKFNFVTGKKSKKIIDKENGQRTFDVANPFYWFLRDSLPGFDYTELMDLQEEVWLLVIALVYYVHIRNGRFINAAYSVLLSYVMLGPVSEKVGIIKRSNFSVSHNTCEDNSRGKALTQKDCLSASNALMNMFYVQDIENKFDRNILHEFAEFQHCLQHMNYLNKVCRENIKSTVYHKTYNGTFVYNLFLLLKDEKRPVDCLGNLLQHSSVFVLFKIISDVFDKCLLSVAGE